MGVRVACVQMCSGVDVAANAARACALVREAAGAGAVYVQTPEMTTLLERDRAVASGGRVLVINRLPIASRGRPIGSVTTLQTWFAGQQVYRRT